MSKVEWKYLNDMCCIYDGTHQTPKYTNAGVKFVSVENINAPYKSSKYISEDDYSQNYKTKPQKGDVLMTRIGDVGTCAVLDNDEPLAYYVSLALLRPNSQLILSNYVKYILESNIGKRELRKKTLLTAVPLKINLGDVGKIKLPVPSLSEQNRIVEILDTFTASIDNLKEQIALRRKQYEYYRDQLLDLEGKDGVEMKTLGNIAKYRRGSFPQPYGNSEWYGGEGAMPFVQVADVEEMGMKLKDTTKQYISRIAMPKSVFVPSGSVIVTLQGSIGKVAITQYDSYVDRTLGIFEGYRIDINKKYFAHQLERVFSEKRKKARGGTIKTITKEEFTNFTIPIPSTISQQLIVDILDKFEESIQNLETQLAEREKQYEYYRNKLLTFE